MTTDLLIGLLMFAAVGFALVGIRFGHDWPAHLGAWLRERLSAPDPRETDQERQ